MDDLLRSLTPILESYIDKKHEILIKQINGLQSKLDNAKTIIQNLKTENNNLKEDVLALRGKNCNRNKDNSSNDNASSAAGIDQHDKFLIDNVMSSPRDDINSFEKDYRETKEYDEIVDSSQSGKFDSQNVNEMNKFTERDEKISSSLDLSKDNTFNYRFDSSPIDLAKENCEEEDKIDLHENLHCYNSNTPPLHSSKEFGLFTPITVKDQPIKIHQKRITVRSNNNNNINNRNNNNHNQKKRNFIDLEAEIESTTYSGTIVNGYKFKRLNVDQIIYNIKHSISIDLTFNPITGKKWVLEDFVENITNEKQSNDKVKALESLLKTFKKITTKKIDETSPTFNYEFLKNYDKNLSTTDAKCEDCQRLVALTGYGVKIMSPSWDDTQSQNNKKYIKAMPVCTHRTQGKLNKMFKNIIRENEYEDVIKKSFGYIRDGKLDSKDDGSDLETPPGYFNSSFPSTQQLLEEKKKAKAQTGKITLKKFLSSTDISFPRIHIFVFRNKLFNKIVDDGYFSYNHIIIAEYLHILDN